MDLKGIVCQCLGSIQLARDVAQCHDPSGSTGWRIS
jgi:hypothetical protein